MAGFAVATVATAYFVGRDLHRRDKELWKNVERPQISWTRAIVTICILLGLGVFEYFAISARLPELFALILVIVLNAIGIGVVLQNAKKSRRDKSDE